MTGNRVKAIMLTTPMMLIMTQMARDVLRESFMVEERGSTYPGDPTENLILTNSPRS